jgi:hypothetical protein
MWGLLGKQRSPHAFAAQSFLPFRGVCHAAPPSLVSWAPGSASSPRTRARRLWRYAGMHDTSPQVGKRDTFGKISENFGDIFVI